MAFLSYSDVSDYTGTIPQAVVDGWLASIELSLTQLGLVFESPTTGVKKLYSDLWGRKVFHTYPVNNITAVTVKKQYDSSYELNMLNGTDYIEIQNNYATTELRTRFNIFEPDFIEVAGTFGIFIDFDNPTAESNLVKTMVIEFLKDFSHIFNRNQTVSSSRTGEISVAYSHIDISSQIVTSPYMQRIKNLLLC